MSDLAACGNIGVCCREAFLILQKAFANDIFANDNIVRPDCTVSAVFLFYDKLTP